jgi:hypothetical protein
MSQARLSHVAVVPYTSLRDFEFAGAVTRQADINALRAALEKAGVEFISDVGVKMSKRASNSSRWGGGSV